MRHSIWLACALALLPASASADEVFLKSGGRLTGRILVRTATSVSVDVGPGTVTVSMASVDRIEEHRSILDDYDARASALGSDDARGWVALARWAAAEGLGTQARRGYERALAIDPDNADANRALGRTLVDGRWLTEAESYRARGYVQFEGVWMSAADREATLTRREAAVQAEWARLDADRRVRDAEARAAEAEAQAREAQAAAATSTAGIPLWWGSYGWAPGYGWPGTGKHRPRPSPYAPSGTLGTWPSSTLGFYPSRPLGTWPSAQPHGGWPQRRQPTTRPPEAAPRTPPPPPVNGAGAGAGATTRRSGR
jgi:hypothetical protein